jgi:hypothetical protein
LIKFTPFHAEPIRAQLENLPPEVIELIKEHTCEGCELKNFLYFEAIKKTRYLCTFAGATIF